MRMEGPENKEMSGSTPDTAIALNFNSPTSEITPFDMTDSLNMNTIAPNISETFIDVNLYVVGMITGLVTVNLLIVFGNILILLAVCTDRSLRTVTTYFIVNLAVADLLLGALVIPFAGSYQIMGWWIFGEKFCVIWAATDVLCSTASIYGLCCIGIDRYIGVTMPLKHHLIMTKKKALLTIGLSWVLSFAVASGPLLGWRPALDDPKQCPMSDSVDYVLFSTSCSFYIPLLIIVIMYYRIYREVAIQNKGLQVGHKTSVLASGGATSVTLRIHVRISANHKTPANKKLVKSAFSQKVATFNRQKRAAKTLGLVIGAFIICWFPFFFIFPFSKICTTCVSTKVFQTFIWLGYCNSFLNPFIYAYSNKSFRNAFRRLLTCRCSHRNKHNFKNLTNINRYTSSGGDSPLLVPSKFRKNDISKTPPETVTVKRLSHRHRILDERRILMPHILEKDAENSITDVQQSSPPKECPINHSKQRNIDIEKLSSTNLLHKSYSDTSAVNNNAQSYSPDNNNNGQCSCSEDEDEACSFLNNLQNFERFFDESTRIYNNFLKTRSPNSLQQFGRRPSAPSAHISVYVETIDASKRTRRGSYFV